MKFAKTFSRAEVKEITAGESNGGYGGGNYDGQKCCWDDDPSDCSVCTSYPNKGCVDGAHLENC